MGDHIRFDANSAGKAIVQILLGRHAAAMTPELSEALDRLHITVDRYFASNTGSITLSFKPEGATVHMHDESNPFIAGKFNDYSPVLFTDETATVNGYVVWRIAV